MHFYYINPDPKTKKGMEAAFLKRICLQTNTLVLKYTKTGEISSLRLIYFQCKGLDKNNLGVFCHINKFCSRDDIFYTFHKIFFFEIHHIHRHFAGI